MKVTLRFDLRPSLPWAKENLMGTVPCLYHQEEEQTGRQRQMKATLWFDLRPPLGLEKPNGYCPMPLLQKRSQQRMYLGLYLQSGSLVEVGGADALADDVPVRPTGNQLHLLLLHDLPQLLLHLTHLKSHTSYTCMYSAAPETTHHLQLYRVCTQCCILTYTPVNITGCCFSFLFLT